MSCFYHCRRPGVLSGVRWVNEYRHQTWKSVLRHAEGSRPIPGSGAPTQSPRRPAGRGRAETLFPVLAPVTVLCPGEGTAESDHPKDVGSRRPRRPLRTRCVLRARGVSPAIDHRNKEVPKSRMLVPATRLRFMPLSVKVRLLVGRLLLFSSEFPDSFCSSK